MIIQLRAALLVFVSTIMISTGQGQTLAQFEHLKEPRIVTIPAQTMLVVTAKGDPNVVGGRAFGLLFQIYYSLAATPKGPQQPAPRARWPVSLETAKSEWVGHYALPVPKTVTGLPPYPDQSGLQAALTTWEYGEVAEILHVGPYDKEEPTVKKLMIFVKSQGYVIKGDHEEEYIKGPDMYGKGDPDKYLTIIRYPVQKADEY